MEAKGRVFKYGDNVDTDVIIPARYLNSFDAKELATHAMVDLDPTFVERVQPGRKEELWLWIIKRTCPSCIKDSRCFMCYRKKLCTYLLS